MPAHRRRPGNRPDRGVGGADLNHCRGARHHRPGCLAGAVAISFHFYDEASCSRYLTALILWAASTAARCSTHDVFDRPAVQFDRAEHRARTGDLLIMAVISGCASQRTPPRSPRRVAVGPFIPEDAILRHAPSPRRHAAVDNGSVRQRRLSHISSPRSRAAATFAWSGSQHRLFRADLPHTSCCSRHGSDGHHLDGEVTASPCDPEVLRP